MKTSKINFLAFFFCLVMPFFAEPNTLYNYFMVIFYSLFALIGFDLDGVFLLLSFVFFILSNIFRKGLSALFVILWIILFDITIVQFEFLRNIYIVRPMYLTFHLVGLLLQIILIVSSIKRFVTEATPNS